MASTAAMAARKESIPVDALPESLKIVDCEKRRGVSRYYCYILEVTRKNGDIYHIYRRYRQFDKMVTRLEERFPVEAGSIRASDRIIPLLPGKKYAKRSAVRNIAEERLPLLNDFLQLLTLKMDLTGQNTFQKLYSMSDKIRYDSIVIAFLKQTHEDISNPYKPNIAYPSRRGQPPTRPKSPRPSRSSLSPSRPPPPSKPLPTIQVTAGGVGRPPSSSSNKPPAKSLPPRPSPPLKRSQSDNIPRARAIYNYSAKFNDELSFREGDILTLIRKVEGSWYQCKLEDRVGIVPGNYLNILQALPDEEDDSSEDEWEDDDHSTITCRYKGRDISIEVDSELIRRPVYSKLMFIIRSQTKDSKIVLNYKDSAGDLIEMMDDSDVQIMTEEGVGSRTVGKHLAVPSAAGSNNTGSGWMIYATAVGDTTVYHTHPYEKPKPV